MSWVSVGTEHPNTTGSTYVNGGQDPLLFGGEVAVPLRAL
jgi:hypothetical protein